MTLFKKGEEAVKAPVRRILLLVMAAIFLLSATAFATPPVMYDVTIYDGETVTNVTTAETDAEKVLANAGITVNEAYGDSVSYANFTAENGSTIIINRGVKVTINNHDGTSHTVYTSGTVSKALKVAGIKLPEGTALNYDAGEILKDGMVIEIYDIYDITIEADGETITKTLSGGTVADALALAGIKLGEDDYTKPGLKAVLKDDLKIEVFRVTIEKRTEKEAIPYETEKTYTDTLYAGEEKVITQGVDGAKAIVYEDRYVNGELQSSTYVSEAVLTQPTNKVMQVGTKPKIPTIAKPQQNSSAVLPIGTPMSEIPLPADVIIGANGLPTTYRQVINAQATAYSLPGRKTSTGVPAQNGYVAVDPKEIPYGTEMYIVSADGRYVYGYAIAADTGSYIDSVDWTVDLHMNTEAECIQWGRRDVIIYIL